MRRAAAVPGVVMASPAGEDLRIPVQAHGLAGFRAWLRSESFPELGRIDYLGGDVEIDMAPEDLQTHGTLKSAVAAELFNLVARPQHGYVFIDRTRVTSPAAGLSVEPDVVVVLFSSLDQGRVRQVPMEHKGPGRFIELEGAPDLIVEVLSDTSERKDLERLPPRYARAGVPELWLLDARGDEPALDIRSLVEGEYRSVEPDRDGWLESPVLAARFRLTRKPAPHAGWFYDLSCRPVT
jgi:Uma2 family endonuclease